MGTFTTTYRKRMPITLGKIFSPLDIAGCVCWLDAADAGSVTTSGSNITSWTDKSGTGNSVSASSNWPTYNTSGASQLNGQNTISFVATTSSSGQTLLGTWAGAAMTSGVTVFAVSKPDVPPATNNNGMIVRLAAASGNEAATLMVAGATSSLAAKGTLFLDSNPSGVDLETYPTTNLNANTWRINMGQVSVSAPTATGTLYSNNVLIAGPSSATGSYSTCVGSTLYAVCSDTVGTNFISSVIAEIIYYSSAINSTDYTSVANYLSSKWNLALGTPVY